MRKRGDMPAFRDAGPDAVRLDHRDGPIGDEVACTESREFALTGRDADGNCCAQFGISLAIAGDPRLLEAEEVEIRKTLGYADRVVPAVARVGVGAVPGLDGGRVGKRGARPG